LLFQISGVRQI